MNFLLSIMSRPSYIHNANLYARKSGIFVYTGPCRLLYNDADYMIQTITAIFPREISEKLQLQRQANPLVNSAGSSSL